MKRNIRTNVFVLAGALVLASGIWLVAAAAPAGKSISEPLAGSDNEQGVVDCANLIYAHSKTSVCFADEFLSQLRRDSSIRANRRFYPVKLDSEEMFDFPFAVMTGEGSFTLTEDQRRNLRRYVLNGGFLVASSGCSSSTWDVSFRNEIQQTFPEMTFKKLPMTHPIFHMVYDIDRLKTKNRAPAYLSALEHEGKIVLVYSREGLNDTQNAGPGCCCCGGNEILNARQVNANLLAYALTH